MIRGAAAAFCLAFAAVATAADVARAPAPAWVQPALRPAPVALSAPRVYEVWDTQIRAAGAASEQYEHRVLRVNRPEGLKDAGIITVDYAPDYQKLEFHTLRLVRQGESIDLLPRAEFRLVNRERLFAEGVVSGRVSAVAQITDLRVGDAIDYSYRIVGANPVFGETAARAIAFDTAAPVGLRRVRMLDTSGRQTRFRIVSPRGAEPFDVKSAKTSAGYETEIVGQDVRPVIFEPGLPSGFMPWTTVYFSGYDSWAEVGRWGERLLAPAAARGPKFEELVARLKAQPQREAIAEAVRFVQDEIRYFSVSIGENSHRPQAPEVVLERRYGDCKDKSVLLAALLGRIGVKATPAVVSTGIRGRVDAAGPSPVAFDHMILRISYGGRDYWIDATRSSSGMAFDKQATMLGGARALPIGGASLVTIPYQGVEVAVSERIKMASLHAPADYQIETRIMGPLAETYRALDRNWTAGERSRRFGEGFARRYPDSKAASTPETRDDQESGAFVIAEHYEVPSLFRGIDTNRKVANFQSRQLLNWLQGNIGTMRIHPYAIPGARGTFTYDALVHVAEGLSGRDDPITDVYETPHFRLQTRRSFRGDTFRFSATLTVTGETVQPAAIAAYLESVKKAEAKLLDIMVLTPDNMVGTSEASRKPLGERMKAEQQGHADAATKVITAGRLGDEETADAYAARARARTALGNTSGAIADFNAALRLRPYKGEYLAGRASAHIRAGNLPAAEADLTQALTLSAEPTMTYLRRGHVRFLRARHADALEDFNKAEKANETGGNAEFIGIWQALARLRLGQDPKPALVARFKTRSQPAWPNALLRHLAGEAAEQDVLAEAQSGSRDEREPNLCEAYYYLGLLALGRGDAAAAKAWMQKSVETGIVTYMEYELALDALRSLGT